MYLGTGSVHGVYQYGVCVCERTWAHLSEGEV